MGPIPIPPPPDVAQAGPPQQGPGAGPGMADKVGQLRSAPQQLASQGISQLDLEVKNLAEQVMKVAQMASALHRPLLGDLSKMAEIGMSLQSQMKNLVMKQQGDQGAQPEQPTAPSPTDATPGA